MSVAIDSLVWMTQFGPLFQKECGLASMAGKASLFDDDEKKYRGVLGAHTDDRDVLRRVRAVLQRVVGEVSSELMNHIERVQDSVTALMGGSTAVASLTEYTALVEKLTTTDKYEGPGPYVDVDVDEDTPLGTAAFTITDEDVSMGGGDFAPAGSISIRPHFHVYKRNAEASASAPF